MGVKYRRDLPGGAKETYETAIQRPPEEQKYFDDMIMNNALSIGQPLQFYRFGRERSYPLRTVRHFNEDRFILHYVLAGTGFFKGERISRGQGFVIFPGEENTMAADNDEPWHFCWMIFGGRDAYSMLKSVGIDRDHCIFDFSFFEKVENIFEQLIYIEHEDADMDLYMCSRFYELLSYHKKQYISKVSGEDYQKNYVIRTENYIDLNFMLPIKVDEIADMLHISRKYLGRIFSEYKGISVKEYILSKRIDEASRLLCESELSVGEISRMVGYADYTQLTRLFKLKKGISPIQYRYKYSRR